MGEIIILLGPPGAGKSTQAKLVSEALGAKWLSMGEIMRASTNPIIQRSVAAGDLPPSELAEVELADVLQKLPADQVILLDGFPREVPETNWLDRYTAASGRRVKAVISLKLTQAEAQERLGLRHRADDDINTLMHRFRVYEQETEPVLKEFKARGLLREVNAVGDPEEIKRDILGKL